MRNIFASCILVLSLLSTSYADQQFQSWGVVEANDKSGDSIAFTVTDDLKGFFAVRCFREKKSCAHFVILDTRCEDQGEYPILVNAPSGSVSLKGLCSINQGKYEMALMPFDSIRSLMSSSGMIGFAIPMESGAFKAVRFKLAGNKDAISLAEKMAGKAAGKSVQKNSSYTF